MEVEENSESNNSPMELLDWRQNEKLIFINVYLEGLRQEQELSNYNVGSENG